MILRLLLVCAGAIAFIMQPLHAQSFDKDDLRAFLAAQEAIEKSDLLTEDAEGGSLLDQINPFAGLGDMAKMMFGGTPTGFEDGQGSLDGFVTEAGDMVMFRGMITVMKQSPETVYLEEITRISSEAGFADVDEYALKSDAIMGAIMAAGFEPMMGEIVEGFKSMKAQVQKEASQTTGDTIRKIAINRLLGGLLEASNLPIPKSLILGDKTEEYEQADSGGNILLAIVQARLRVQMMRQMAGMIGMQEETIQRLILLVAITPAEDLEFIRKNEKMLPEEMRFSD